VLIQRLGDQSCGIREINEPCRRRQPFNYTSMFQGYRDRPQGHGDAAGASRLLAREPFFDGDSFVPCAGRHAANAEAA
jgi:hypothetical protein